MVCKYSTLLGTPGEGIHKHYFGFAVADILATLIVAEIISYVFQWNFIVVLFALVLTGIVVHRILCVRTEVDKILFP
jgi:TM2 domain-containing membrane protein YozV